MTWAKETTARLFAPFFIICAPLAYILNIHDYPLFRSEIALIVLVILIVGIAFGLVSYIFGRYITCFVLVGLAAFSIDSITNVLTHVGWKLMVVCLVVFALTLLLREFIARLASAAGLLATLFFLLVPMEHPLTGRSATVPPIADHAALNKSGNLPLRIHIILSDHIAVEGIPIDIPGGQEVQKAVKELYLENGFTLFPRAYSTHVRGTNSVSAMFNFVDLAKGSYIPYYHNSTHFIVTRNEYFQRLRDEGYQLDLFQFSYLDFCQSPLVNSCQNYHADDLRFLPSTNLETRTKTWIIADVLLSRSLLFQHARTQLEFVAAHLKSLRISLPLWRSPPNSLPGIAATMLWNNFLKDVTTQRSGRFLLFYLMLPHYPYMYEQDCTLRTDPQEWLSRYGMPNNTNNSETRSQRYQVYFKQLACTNKMMVRLFKVLKDQGMWDQTMIVVHGDHGPRIGRNVPFEHMVNSMLPEDHIDNFSTLFAIKQAGTIGGYDRRLLPLDAIWREIIKGEPASESGVARPIYIPGPPGKFTRMEMPVFPLKTQ